MAWKRNGDEWRVPAFNADPQWPCRDDDARRLSLRARAIVIVVAAAGSWALLLGLAGLILG